MKTELQKLRYAAFLKRFPSTKARSALRQLTVPSPSMAQGTQSSNGAPITGVINIADTPAVDHPYGLSVDATATMADAAASPTVLPTPSHQRACISQLDPDSMRGGCSRFDVAATAAALQVQTAAPELIWVHLPQHELTRNKTGATFRIVMQPYKRRDNADLVPK